MQESAEREARLENQVAEMQALIEMANLKIEELEAIMEDN